MLTNNYPEAEKYFRRYLERDPDGPGASIARKFLASLPAAAPSLSPTMSPSETTAPATSAAIEAGSSSAALAPEDVHPSANWPRTTTDSDENRPAQVEGMGNASTPQKDELRKTFGEANPKKGLTPGIISRRMGFVLMGTGALLGGAALAAYSDDSARIELGITALAVAAGGFAIYAYGRSQLRAAKAVAWSPVVGSGFAGVALGGRLP